MSVLSKYKQLFGLSLSIAVTSFKLRNEGSYLGILWYLLNPILVFLLLLGIFLNRLGKDIPNYSIYLLLGIIMYNFFQAVSISAIKSMDENHQIIKAVGFSKEALFIANLIRSLFAHFFELVVFVIIALFFGIGILGFIFYLPILFFYCIFLYGLSLILATLYIHMADLENIWSFFLRLLFFVTPIFYLVEPNSRLYIINLLNPLFYYITIARNIIIYNKVPEIHLLLIMMIFSIVVFMVGRKVFDLVKDRIAELV